MYSTSQFYHTAFLLLLHFFLTSHYIIFSLIWHNVLSPPPWSTWHIQPEHYKNISHISFPQLHLLRLLWSRISPLPFFLLSVPIHSNLTHRSPFSPYASKLSSYHTLAWSINLYSHILSPFSLGSFPFTLPHSFSPHFLHLSQHLAPAGDVV